MVRLQAAKTLLARVEPLRHDKVSSLQSEAVIDKLKTAALRSSMNAEEKASVTEFVLSVNFVSGHTDAILAEIDGSPRKQRRLGQDFTAWISYAGEQEWRAIMSPELDDAAVVSICVDIVMRRLRCRNPSESTKKLIASVVLARGSTMDTVFQIPMFRKTAIKTAVFQRIEAVKRKCSQPSVYLLALPAQPETLKLNNKPFYDAVQVPSGFVMCPIDAAVLAAVDTSYNCRGGSASQHQLPTVQTPHAGLGAAECGPVMMMVQMMQHMMQQSSQNDNLRNGMPITLNPGRKRCLSALALESESDSPEAARQRARTSLGLSRSGTMQIVDGAEAKVESCFLAPSPDHASPDLEASPLTAGVVVAGGGAVVTPASSLDAGPDVASGDARSVVKAGIVLSVSR